MILGRGGVRCSVDEARRIGDRVVTADDPCIRSGETRVEFGLYDTCFGVIILED